MTATTAMSPAVTYQTVQQLTEDEIYAVPRIPAPSPLSRLATLASVALSPLLLLATVVVWLLPASRVRSWFNRNVAPRLLELLAAKTTNQRRLLLARVQGKVLDVGTGTGAYLRFYQNASHVTCLEPCVAYHEAIRKANTVGLADYQLSVRSELLQDFESAQRFDWIVVGNMLCEVDDVEAAVERLYQLLQPGTGRLYFSEHVGSPVGTWRRTLQDWIDPTHRRIACHCNRDSVEAIQARFEDVVAWPMENVRIAGGPLVMGLARRVEPDL